MGTELSADEVIATLNHSELPTLVAEGRDDVVVLRRFEDSFRDAGLSVLPVGGRDNVLGTFVRRNEVDPEKVILFCADQDAFIYLGIPDEYAHDSVYFTDGYSIENDLYRDGGWEKFLTASERIQFRADLDWFLRWYALTLWRHLQGEEAEFGLHPSALANDANRYDLDCTLSENEHYPEDFRDQLVAQYPKLLRGKSLMALLVRRLSAPDRPAKHSKRALLEYGAAADGPLMARFYDWIRERLEANGLPVPAT